MILNAYGQSNFFKVIQTLMNSPFELYLTGSRFFGVNKPNSDYDFFVKDSPEVRAQLEHSGFSLLVDEDYKKDTSFAAIYVLYLDVEIIQVQVIKEDEFLIKKEAQDLLASVYGDFRNTVVAAKMPEDKEARKSLWEFAKAVVSNNTVIPNLQVTLGARENQ